MRQKIKMPSHISSLTQYREWVESFNTTTSHLEISMKQRPNFSPQNMQEHNHIVFYQIDDGITSGRCTLKRFNQVFTFEVFSCK